VRSTHFLIQRDPFSTLRKSTYWFESQFIENIVYLLFYTFIEQWKKYDGFGLEIKSDRLVSIEKREKKVFAKTRSFFFFQRLSDEKIIAFLCSSIRNKNMVWSSKSKPIKLTAFSDPLKTYRPKKLICFWCLRLHSKSTLKQLIILI